MRPLVPFLLLSFFLQEEPPPAPTSSSDMIDRHVAAEWKKNNVNPAKPVDDAEFLRRVHLDIIGSIPPVDLVVRFLNDRTSGKRMKLVNELLDSDRYAENWAEIWESMLIGYDFGIKNDSGDSLQHWLRDDVFAKNLRYDDMFRQLMTATGSTKADGRNVFLWRFPRQGGGPIEAITRISRVFLGTQIQCAQCHDHPFDKWTQDDFYGLAAFFSRTRVKKVRQDDPRDQEFEVFDMPRGEMEYGEGRQRKKVNPKYLDGTAPDAAQNRRDAFARLTTRRTNLLFPTALVNRYWCHFFGRGLIHPVEEINDRNKPSHPALLDELAEQFVQHQYDLKWLIRTLCSTKTYQLSSRRGQKDAPAPRLFAHALTRAMSPDELLNSMIEATGTEEKLRVQAKRAGGNLNVMNFKREMLRQFRFAFGDDENVEKTEFDGTVPQALLLMNGELINRGIVDKDNRLDQILRTRPDPADRLDMIFLSVLGRHPNTREVARYGAHLGALKFDRKGFEDIFWTLLNSSEFMFSH